MVNVDLKDLPAARHWFVLALPFVCWPFPTVLSSLRHINTGMETHHAGRTFHWWGRGPVSVRGANFIGFIIKVCGNSPMMWLHSSLLNQHRPGTSYKNIAGKQIIKPLPDKTWKGKWCVLADSATLVSLSPHGESGVPASVVPLKSSQCLFMSCTPVLGIYIFVRSLSWIPLLTGLKAI